MSRLFNVLRRVLRAACMILFFTGMISVSRAFADDEIPLNVIYVCNGEHIYVENCNIRDTSDNGTCMVGHPDHLNPSGINTYTYLTRGALKKLLPSCQQPSAKQLAAAKARQQRQQATIDAVQKKAEDSVMTPPTAGQTMAAMQQSMIPKDPDERQMNRCITAGRLPASCTGNALLGGFSKMIGSTVSSLTGTQIQDSSKPPAGPIMAGVFVGEGNWRIDFVDGGVLVNCSMLSPNEETYSVKFEPGRADLILNTKPKPLVLAIHPDATLAAPGPVTIQGVIATGYHDGRPSNAMYIDHAGNYYDAGGNKLQTTAGYSTFSPKTVTCPALNLSTKGATVGIQTMQTDLLKSMMGGDKGPPTPPGIRMQGIYAATTGFSIQFFPESAILGCGPDSARAYPYEVVAGPGGGIVKIDAQDRPLTLALRPDNSLDPGSGAPYQVHGRLIAGQTDDGEYRFVPYEQTCGLALLTPSQAIPASGGTASMMTAMNAASPTSGGTALSSPQAPLGNGALSIVSGLTAQTGQPNPLANRPLVLLRQSYTDALLHAGIMVPAGMSPFKYSSIACGTGSPDCQKISQAIQASAASAVRADASGKGTFPGVPAGTYYLMISAIENGKPLVWQQAVQIHPGSNAITLDQSNATPLQ